MCRDVEGLGFRADRCGCSDFMVPGSFLDDRKELYSPVKFDKHRGKFPEVMGQRAAA